MDEELEASLWRLEALAVDGPPPALSGAEWLAIGDMSRAVGLSPRALRFYEAKGLLAPRRNAGARLYGRADHDRLMLVLKAKRLGFTLDEIKRMLAAPHTEAPALNLSRRQYFDQIRFLEQRKREIEAALGELRRTYSSFYARIVAAT